MIWDDDRTSALKRMWAEGVYASKIASTLGHVTRNAVIGKANRLGLDKRKHTPAGKPASNRPMAANVPPKLLHTTGPTRRYRRCEDKKRKKPIPAEVVALLDNAIPLEQRRTLFTVKANECHFPVGEPGHIDFFYCGAPVPDDDGRQYCQTHRDRMFTKTAPRVRKPKPVSVFRLQSLAAFGT